MRLVLWATKQDSPFQKEVRIENPIYGQTIFEQPGETGPSTDLCDLAKDEKRSPRDMGS